MKKLIMILMLLYSCVATCVEIPFTTEDGVKRIPITFNGVVTLSGILDSGASELVIPLDVATTLARAGTISADDELESIQIQIADGSISTKPKYNIKQIDIGGITLYNVGAVVIENTGDILMGQGMLERFNTWSVDNTRKVLILGEQTTSTSTAPNPTIWVKELPDNTKIAATDIPCGNQHLIDLGYQFEIWMLIPTSRVKSINDVFDSLQGDYSMTVRGCWNPERHQAYYNRKSDNKWWTATIKVTNDWVKLSN